MTEHPKIEQYISTAGMQGAGLIPAEVTVAIRDLLDALGELPDEFDEVSLYRYSVPRLSEDGSCSIIEELDPTPYDLSQVLGGRSEAITRRLRLLNLIVERAAEVTGADWVGIYQSRSLPGSKQVLVKLAYRGLASRAEFPLTQEFAAGSTNSAVGLSGIAKVIADVPAYRAAGGGFYVCDNAVQSEACLPILSGSGQVVGIIDAEAEPKSFFNATRLSTLVAACLVAEGLLP